MGNNSSRPSAETIQGVDDFDVYSHVGGRKRTLRKRTRRGGQPLQILEAYGGRKRTLRKRTRRG